MMMVQLAFCKASKWRNASGLTNLREWTACRAMIAPKSSEFSRITRILG